MLVRTQSRDIVLMSWDLYIQVGWPLYRNYGHAFEGFKLIVKDPDSVFNFLTSEVKEIGPDGQEVSKVVPALSEELKDALVKNIKRRMTPHPLKIRADIEMKCFQFDGVLHIKEAMRKAEAAGNKDCPVKISVVAPPLYILTTQTLDREQGIAIINVAIAACTEEIEPHGGRLALKEAASTVSERDDKLFDEDMAKLSLDNEELTKDEYSEEDEGMGDIDLENSGSWLTEWKCHVNNCEFLPLFRFVNATLS
ncbi:eukaryotic translation initiation factor 2 subunit 1 [Actinidia rufa]|uniref:Eukaryotic translation initiation factor 2 subunit 1 n=1 Tax=Actinidia rufa TaxID=165716 RepID=A0A7J0HFG6_9ERIC|nr:eukaryotic translation initiation factor 2 subunit 1 [Actinidia rufa]